MVYTKFHTNWAGTDQLTGEAWNHIEGQWNHITPEADAANTNTRASFLSQWNAQTGVINAHTHNTRYYLKTTADVTFFSTSYFTGFDCDKLDGYHLSDMASTVFPVGSILMWSGTDGNVPATWVICNGGSGTPDLRDFFVSGCDIDANLGSGSPAIGPATWNGTITPTGSVAIGNHVLSTAELPVHTHTYNEYCNTWKIYTNPYSDADYVMTSRNAAINNQNEGGGGAHGHTGSSISFSEVDPRPLYYALYYIMKVS